MLNLNWSESAPQAAKCKALDLERVPAKGKTGGIIQNARLCGTYTHYWGGRTVPCFTSTCPACAAGIGRRWHSYLGIFQPNARRSFILELTAKGSEQLEKLQEEFTTLRGIQVIFERKGNRPNSPTHMFHDLKFRDQFAVPPEIDIPGVLAIIWGLNEEVRHSTVPSYDSMLIKEKRRNRNLRNAAG